MWTWARRTHGLALCLLLALLCAGCTGALVDRLNERHVSSCVWWTTALARGVSATGEAQLSECLAQRHTWP